MRPAMLLLAILPLLVGLTCALPGGNKQDKSVSASNHPNDNLSLPRGIAVMVYNNGEQVLLTRKKGEDKRFGFPRGKGQVLKKGEVMPHTDVKVKANRDEETHETSHREGFEETGYPGGTVRKTPFLAIPDTHKGEKNKLMYAHIVDFKHMPQDDTRILTKDAAKRENQWTHHLDVGKHLEGGDEDFIKVWDWAQHNLGYVKNSKQQGAGASSSGNNKM